MTGFPGYLSGAALMIGTMLAAGAAEAAANATRGYDPWTAVPAFPTALYSSQDQFTAKAEAALTTVSKETERQREINSQVTEHGHQQMSAQAASDPMELARQIQERMAQDPQAMAAMTNPAGVQQQLAHGTARDQEMEAADAKFIAQYQAALKAALEPSRARFRALAKKVAPEVTAAEGGDVWPAWGYKEANVILGEADKAYEALAMKWFAAGGQVPTYLQRRRDYLVNERIPYREQHFDAPSIALYGKSDNPAGTFRSLAPFEAVQDYLKLAEKLYGLRTVGSKSFVSAVNGDDPLGIMN
jgi:hypothetical protein